MLGPHRSWSGGESETKQTLDEVCILLGGGLDSTALIPFYLSRGDCVRGVHFDYGQPSAEGERRSVLEIAAYYAIPTEMVDLGLPVASVRDEYLCRNAIFLLGAASILDSTNARLSLGIHAGTLYYDCSSPFLADVQRLLDGYFGGTVRVEAPLIEFTKRDVFDFCLRNQVPIDLTFSCERQSIYPCGECRSCGERAMLREGHEGF